MLNVFKRLRKPMNYEKEFKDFAIKDQGINSMYYDKVVSSMMPTGLTPNIIEERQLNAIAMDVFLNQANMDISSWRSLFKF